MTTQELQSLYQQTGAPLHSSYALPQLLALYKDPNNQSLLAKVHRWTTISSICLHRWMGSGVMEMPISYSEAR